MLNLAKITIADFPTGLNQITFDIDPQSYDPFAVPIRGSSAQVLDGTVVHQFFGLQPEDFTITVTGFLLAYDTLQALWTKYRQSGGGQTFQWTDWYPNSFEVVFQPGKEAFKPVYVLGTKDVHSYTLTMRVLSVIQWFGGTY